MRFVRLFAIATLLLTILTLPAWSDQVTFSFVSIGGNTRDVEANAGGFRAGPGLNLLVTDSTTGISVPLSGLVTANTGEASSYNVTPGLVTGTFEAGGDGSVRITDLLDTRTILVGIMAPNSHLLATANGGTGSFLAVFTLVFIDPTILSEFGLSHPDLRGSFSSTFGQDLTATTRDQTLTAVGGGGTITITAAPIPEVSTLALAGTSLLMGLAYFRRRSS